MAMGRGWRRALPAAVVVLAACGSPVAGATHTTTQTTDATTPTTCDAADAKTDVVQQFSRVGEVVGGRSIPAGMTAQGLPVGVEFDALAGYDSELLALGIAVEQAWPKIPAPQPIA